MDSETLDENKVNQELSIKAKLVSKRWLILVYGLALLLLMLLGSILVTAYPPVWEKIHRSAMQDSLREKHYVDANKITSGLWSAEPYEEISESLSYWKKMNEKEIAHYEDVRDLLGVARVVLVVCAAIVLLGCFLAGWKKVWLSGFASFVLLGIIAGIWMMIHWHSLFKALHWAIFWDDSWKLPLKSYSLGLFPHKVWQQAGGVVAILISVPLLVPILGSFLRSKMRKPVIKENS